MTMGDSAPADADPEHPVDEFVSVSHLIEEPSVARIYTYVLRNGPVTADEIIDDLDGSPWGTEIDLERLESLGIVTREETDSEARYTAEPISLRLEADGEPFLLTPTFVGGVARMDEDDDVRSYVKRHGVGGLATALTAAVRGLRDGEPEEGELDDTDEAVVETMRDLADEYQDIDPYFDAL